MPLVPPAMAASIYPSLLGVGCLGIGTPKLALGVALGLAAWSRAVRVPITAAGVVGTGIVAMPLLVPSPLLLPALLGAFTSAGMLGIFTPVFAVGLSQGIAAALLPGIITAAVPGVGSGAGVATFRGTAVPFMIQGFASAGLVGPGAVKEARAIGQGLDTFFAGFSMPVIVVGPSGPGPGAATVTGQIL